MFRAPSVLRAFMFLFSFLFLFLSAPEAALRTSGLWQLEVMSQLHSLENRELRLIPDAQYFCDGFSFKDFPPPPPPIENVLDSTF